jgi:glutamine synthetase
MQSVADPRKEITMSSGFVAAHGLFTAAQQDAADKVRSEVERLDLEMIRLSWPDQHGLLRGKALTKEAFLSALDSGAEITMAPFFFDTANAIVFNPFMSGGGFSDPALSGSPNVIMVPDPSTFKVLPWAPATGWVLCDLYMRDGEPFPFAPRRLLKDALDRLGETGYDLQAGIEIEWYLTRITDLRLDADPGAPGNRGVPPAVMPVARGYSYLLENHLDEIDDVLAPIRKHLLALGLPLRSTDDEWGPSQVEITFGVMDGLAAADAVVLFRNAVKQICRRAGYLATFMCTPAIPGFYASGWHLHTSLQDRVTGRNAMIPAEGEVLSQAGRHYVGGTLAHASAASVFATQTVNGYRRRRPYSLAPDRVTWGFDNRAAMMRVLGSPGDPSTHVENRVGEPAANPYLYIAAQVMSGWDGLVNKIDPGPPSDDPYAEEVEVLPQDLGAALDALESDRFFRGVWGDRFIDYLVTMKRSELDRYLAHVAEQSDPEAYAAEVTDWEHREYFELY